MIISDILKKEISTINIGNKPPGVCISGGIDSSVILHHVIKDLMGGDGSKVNTFTAIFGNDMDEGEKARSVSKYYRTNHTEILVTREEILSLFPFIMRNYPFPRFNVWPWILVKEIMQYSDHLFIGEGGDELFGYPDRSFFEGWAGQIIWVFPAWETACRFHKVSLHAPFMNIQRVVNEFYLPPNKEILRSSYKGVLPDFIINQGSTPPSHGFYKMMDMSKEELQVRAVRAWLSTRLS